MWVDVARCTGCGACVEPCPVGAIALVDGQARVDEQACTGCGTCVDVCPEGAIQPVIQGELVPAGEPPVPAVRRPGPLAETAGAAVAVAGAGLLVRAARGLARALGRWLTQSPAASTRSPARGQSPVEGKDRAGRRTCHRRRGGR